MLSKIAAGFGALFVFWLVVFIRQLTYPLPPGIPGPVNVDVFVVFRDPSFWFASAGAFAVGYYLARIW